MGSEMVTTTYFRVMRGYKFGLARTLETTALKLALQKIFAGPVIGFTWNFHPKGQI